MEQKPNYQKAERVARQVRRENNIVRPPILPAQIIELYNLKIRYVTFDTAADNVCGFIEFGKNLITVNAGHHANRQTFTIAHELGHYLLHKDLFEAQPERYEVLLRHPLGKESDTLEKEANAFAAELLVPKDMLKMYAKYATDTQLSDLFAVSEDVIRFRKAIV